LKILWLAHRDIKNPRAGGAERTIYEVTRRLVKDGFYVTILTAGFKGCKRFETIEGVKVFRYDRILGPHLVLPYKLLKENYDFVINDLGHVVPWPSAPILSKKILCFFVTFMPELCQGRLTLCLLTFYQTLKRSIKLFIRNLSL